MAFCYVINFINADKISKPGKYPPPPPFELSCFGNKKASQKKLKYVFLLN